MKFPNLFLAGAPKCGTTSLADYLGQHPEIYSPLVKEPVFFGQDLTARNKRRTLENYRSLFDKWDEEPYALDASTHYFYSQTAAEEIAEVSPDARVIVMVRNPVEATYSMHNQMLFSGAETLQDFEASLNAEEDRAKRITAPDVGFAESLLYSRVYSFTENIRKFERAFGPERVKVVVLEDMRRDAAGTVKDLCGFLEIATDQVDSFTFDIKNPASRPRFRWLTTLALYPPAWVGYLSKPLLSRDQRLRLRRLIGAKNKVPITRPPMDPDVRRKLAAKLQPEIERLSKHLDRDFSHWR